MPRSFDKKGRRPSKRLRMYKCKASKSLIARIRSMEACPIASVAETSPYVQKHGWYITDGQNSTHRGILSCARYSRLPALARALLLKCVCPFRSLKAMCIKPSFQAHLVELSHCCSSLHVKIMRLRGSPSRPLPCRPNSHQSSPKRSALPLLPRFILCFVDFDTLYLPKNTTPGRFSGTPMRLPIMFLWDCRRCFRNELPDGKVR